MFIVLGYRFVRLRPYHQEIWNEIQRQVEQGLARPTMQGSSYIGTSKPCYSLRAEVFSRIGRDWLKRQPGLNPSEYLALLDSLSRGESHEEFVFAGLLLRWCPALRKTLDPQHLSAWLDQAEGWAEVDSICQSNFTADEMLSNWRAWKSLLISLSKSQNVHKRRASLPKIALRETRNKLGSGRKSGH